MFSNKNHKGNITKINSMIFILIDFIHFVHIWNIYQTAIILAPKKLNPTTTIETYRKLINMT